MQEVIFIVIVDLLNDRCLKIPFFKCGLASRQMFVTLTTRDTRRYIPLVGTLTIQSLVQTGLITISVSHHHMHEVMHDTNTVMLVCANIV